MRFCLITLLILSTMSGVNAGVQLELDENTYVDLGVRLQALYLSTENDLNADNRFEADEDFILRRGRIILDGTISERMEAKLETEIGAGAADTSDETRIVDAYLTIKIFKSLNLDIGLQMTPSSRQGLTTSDSLMAFDRPGLAYKALTWGNKTKYQFTNQTYIDSGSKFESDYDERDTGVTLYGFKSFNDSFHFKYYMGTYNGVQLSDGDELRYTGRLQWNFGDLEDSYHVKSTYLGNKQTIGIGVSYDKQDAVAYSLDKGDICYTYYSGDIFAEMPMGNGSLTVETGVINLDLDTSMFTFSSSSREESELWSTLGAQGKGLYLQTGYYINNWQPWFEFETWESKDILDRGNYNIARIGLTYFIKEQIANIKAGYEQFTTDAPIMGVEDTVESMVIGVFLDY
ncbi:MAG: phosphate-selective porin O and P superfamily protein [uncultured bacterium]|nr:MAG: phosphate-selective porin O and P superfamily protein [uncultured bacterium]